MPELNTSTCHHRGFTLIELLMVLAILAIIASIAMPSFMSMLDRARIEAAVTDIETTVRYARSEAIQRNDTVSIKAGASYEDGWSVYASDDSELRRFDGLKAGVQCADCPLSIAFNGRGETPDSGCFTLVDGDITERRKLYLSGGFVDVDACQ
ncbi:GspH/FimT family pseudopilin [Marinobacterium weihaiense]|uniref:GspH/FimT family pseudopilin n=1 Tax=Marinobacterium weihaiense TaxID=2851016 RepID=A0ABS6M9N5_9GAMM|nr:GspH/FimT family pseudopilin [Marinobacterium weihaiense]MBV0932997.1 GspH/FimT family pseudopilin [Marinobacterium weihaiense]